LLGSIDPHGDAHLLAHQMPDLINEIHRLAGRARAASAVRGLDRLRILATRCYREGGELVFEGD
jgi:hypothetical protein